MWAEIAKHLPEFPSAVLTWVDGAGYPFSIRCSPGLDSARQVLDVDLPEGTGVRPGPASLLCHRHDARLWNLKSFLVRGSLERDDQGWNLRPQQFVPGMGIGGPLGWIRLLRNGRSAAQMYVRKRGLAMPGVEWDEVRALLAQAKEVEP
jgi:hypothetical protein